MSDSQKNSLSIPLTLFRMVIFGAAHRWGGGKKPPPHLLLKICHTYPAVMKLGTVIPYLKNIQKIYESHDTPQQILLYQKMQISIAFYYIISNSFSFSWVFKDLFVKPGYNFDDVSKNGYPRSSWNNSFLK